MVRNNANSSVRDRIDALVDAQELRDGVRQIKPSNLTEKKEISAEGDKRINNVSTQQNQIANNIANNNEQQKPKNITKKRLFIVIGSVLWTIVIGLIIVIVVIKLNENPDSEIVSFVQGQESVSDAVENFEEKINNKMQNDSDYDYDNAKNDYVIAINKNNDSTKIELACSYARFLYLQTQDYNESIDALEAIGDSVGSADSFDQMNYYSLLATYYQLSGNKEMAEKYFEKSDSIAKSIKLTEEELKALEDM